MVCRTAKEKGFDYPRSWPRRIVVDLFTGQNWWVVVERKSGKLANKRLDGLASGSAVVTKGMKGCDNICQEKLVGTVVL